MIGPKPDEETNMNPKPRTLPLCCTPIVENEFIHILHNAQPMIPLRKEKSDILVHNNHNINSVSRGTYTTFHVKLLDNNVLD